VGKRYIHSNSSGFVTGTTKVKEDGEGLTLSEILCPIISGAIALYGLWRIFQVLEPWLK